MIQPKVFRHLAAMRSIGLLQVRRQGTWMIYRLDSHLPAWLMQVLQGLP